jgi:glutathione S-transferase
VIQSTENELGSRLTVYRNRVTRPGRCAPAAIAPLRWWKKRLGVVDYFAGNTFTAADIIMLFANGHAGIRDDSERLQQMLRASDRWPDDRSWSLS